MRADFMNSSSKKISNLTQSASDSDSNSDEENDKVMHMQEDHSAFRQLDYLWLFNNELKFMDRPDFQLDDLSVTADDFQLMRQINRRKLTDFFRQVQLASFAQAENDVEMVEDEEGKEETWADENLDEEIKGFIRVYENGKDLPVDVVSHLEYFYNTLDCSF